MNDEQALTKRIRSPVRLVVAILLCLVVGNMGTVVTDTGPGSWYSQLVKPSFTPPGVVIGLIWTVLFILMGIALYLVWMEDAHNPLARIAMGIFGAQLLLNLLWTFLFFGLQSPIYGLVDILTLLIAVAVTIVCFYRVRPAAGALLLPYILWLVVATYLNYQIWVLNP